VTSELIVDGLAALRRGDAAAARAAYAEARSTQEASGADVTGEVLEGLASASFVLQEYPRAIEEMEQAYAAYRAAGDGSGAARVARTLGGMHGTTSGDWAVASGWIARAKTLLAEQPDDAELGWVALTEGMFAPDRQEKHRAFETALEVGRRTHDLELTFSTLAYFGASLVHDDHVEEGMALLDEALAAVIGGEVDSFVVIEEIFCQLFSACEYARDVDRADQWIRVGEQVAERRRLPGVAAYCHTHYGGILTAAGRWPEADAALTSAVRLWTESRRTLRSGALVRLADLRVRQGRYEEAERLLEGLVGDEATCPRATLHLARGENALALDLLEHAVQKLDRGSSSCVPVLSLLVDAQLACGEDPHETVALLDACAHVHPSAYTRAVAAHAHGRAGPGDPKPWLRAAIDGFTEAQLPWEASVCRLDLARACRQSTPEVAVAHARSALETFQALDAAYHADAAAALLRQLGHKVAAPRPSGQTLSVREAEVLELLGEGLSNPEISERLFISRKTVEHHVGNVLAKLGLRNRAEAAAYAVRESGGLQERTRQ
jgi:DNA-binding CsgD family transcriptional regulator